MSRADLPRDTVRLARFLLGKVLVRELDGKHLTGRIVETEAYHEDDPACHAHRGMTSRNGSLFLEAGHAYVYLCYGTSYLLNVASENAGIGAGVLLRALEPMPSLERSHQGVWRGRAQDLARGPGRLTAAMKIDRTHDGVDLCSPGPLWLGTDDFAVAAIGESIRIGLTKGVDPRLRFFIVGSKFLSGTRRLNAPHG